MEATPQTLGLPVDRTVREGTAVGALIGLVASGAAAWLVITSAGLFEAVASHPIDFVAFLTLALALQFVSVEVYGRGRVSVAGIGALAIGLTFGVGAAIAAQVLAAGLHFVQTKPRFHRAVFNAATFSLATGAGTGIYQLLVTPATPTSGRILAALGAGGGFWLVNIGLLTLAMSLSEGLDPRAVWRERFRWLTVYYIAFGPLAFTTALAYEQIGLLGLAAFSVPPALMILSVRQYLERTRVSVEEVRAANEELMRANVELASRHDDMKELFEFAGGLSARAHDRGELVAYSERALAKLTGARTHVSTEVEEGAIALVAGGSPVGSLRFERTETFDSARWGRLREALLPQLSTALESTGLVERVRKTHLATIAALSRSMEAKDFETGGHTERVASVTVALGRRLGFSGIDLDSLEIGALLHDIGKIGIPEAILNKPGKLDEEEWAVMKSHPLVGEYILSGIDLPSIVLQIARSSHERIDGKGYPDAVAGDQIPLPARIVLVADAFDALTSDRPYRRGRSVDAAMNELRANAGTQFCSRVIAALETLYREEPEVLGAAELRIVQGGAA